MSGPARDLPLVKGENQADGGFANALAAPPDALLEVRGLKCYFPGRRAWLRGGQGPIRAVDGVSFWMRRGETLGLVGESGSGKTTTGRTILRLMEPTAGRALFAGADIFEMSATQLRHFRRKAQMVFQDPFGSLNPRLSVGEMLREVLHVHRLGRGAAARRRIAELLEIVGLSAREAARYPHEFSGGQRQRIGIARALAVEPELIVCDEPVSALDLSVQAQVLNLLGDLQRRFGLTYLFIAHDIGVVGHVSDRIAVMYLGRLVEFGSASQVCDEPRHPYTRALLSAVPELEPARRRQRIVLVGDVPSPAAPPPGCHFHPRCPHPLKDADCARLTPELTEKGPAHFAACIKEPAFQAG